MQIFRACFTPREKLEQFSVLCFRKNEICKPGYGACLPVVFFRASTFIFITKISKKTKSHFSLSFVWIEYDLNLFYANF